jgi:hypothetical protein
VPAKYCCLPSITKFVPEVDGKELAFAARRIMWDEDFALLPDQLVVGSALTAPAKEAKAIRSFMLELVRMNGSLPETRSTSVETGR